MQKAQRFLSILLISMLLYSCQEETISTPELFATPRPSIQATVPPKGKSAPLTPPPVCTSSQGSRLSPDGKLITFEPECPQSANQKENIILEKGEVRTEKIPDNAAQIEATKFPSGEFSSGERVAFIGIQNDQVDLFLSDLQGRVTQVTNDEHIENHPIFSPDHQSLAFASNRLKRGFEIFQISVLGKPFIRLSKDFLKARPLSWSSNNEIVFLDKGEIYRLDPATQKSKRLLPGVAVNFAGWSPNGNRIAIVNQGNVLSINREGLNSTTDLVGLNITGKIDWSPDGQWIVYESNQGIYKVNFEDKKPLLLSNQGDSEPEWSPDGQQIVFTSKRRGASNLYLMDAQGKNQRPFISSMEAFQPDW